MTNANDNFQIELDTAPLSSYFAQLLGQLDDLSPLMRSVAETLRDETLQNFESQGRPAWQDLADSTKAQRTKQGTWPGQILVNSARLRNSITIGFDATSAEVGTNVQYAPYLQFGTSKMPARPFLPLVSDSQLQPEAELAVEETLQRWITKLDSANG